MHSKPGVKPGKLRKGKRFIAVCLFSQFLPDKPIFIKPYRKYSIPEQNNIIPLLHPIYFQGGYQLPDDFDSGTII
jgi:hypothetical protein